MAQPGEISVKDEAQLVKDEAQSFIVRAAEFIEEIKLDNPGDEQEHQSICASLAFCVTWCYTLEEIEAYMSKTNGLKAEAVKKLYDGIIAGTGDLAGGQAYPSHFLACSKSEAEQVIRIEERRLSSRNTSISGRPN